MTHPITILITSRLEERSMKRLELIAPIEQWYNDRPMPAELLTEKIAAADVLICNPNDCITHDLIFAAERLRLIITLSEEYTHIDLVAAYHRGIMVCNTPGATDHAVADMAMALILACARHIIDADAFIKHGKWEYWYPELFLGADVQGAAIGIIGMNAVGMGVAHRAQGFGMRVLYYDTSRSPDLEQRLRLQFGGLDNLLREADFVSLHTPNLSTTRHIINEEKLRLMKRSAYLINVSHGDQIDYRALARALREEWIAGAGLDVSTVELADGAEELTDFPNVVMAPHIAANTKGAVSAMAVMAVEQLLQFVRGEQPAHLIIKSSGRRAA